MKKLLALAIAIFLFPSGALASVSCAGNANGWANTAGSADTNVPTNGDFTIAFFAKYTSTALMYPGGIYGTGDILAINVTDDVAQTFTFYIISFNTSANATSNDGVWHSIVFTRSGNTTTVYQDKVGGTTGSGGHDIADSNPLYICNKNTGTSYWNGKIAKYAFYNSVAWSQAQVDSYHDSGGTTIPASPQVRYNFASSAALNTDSSGNGHTLVPNGDASGWTYDTDEPAGGAVATPVGLILSFFGSWF